MVIMWVAFQRFQPGMVRVIVWTITGAPWPKRPRATGLVRSLRMRAVTPSSDSTCSPRYHDPPDADATTGSRKALTSATVLAPVWPVLGLRWAALATDSMSGTCGSQAERSTWLAPAPQ